MGVMDEWAEKALAKLPEPEVLDPQVEHDRKTMTSRQEEKLLDGLNENAQTATDIQGAFLVHIQRKLDSGEIRDHDLGAIMRATSDAQAKAVDAFLKLTGRGSGAPESDTMQLIRSLAKDGLLKMHIDIEVGDKDG